MAARMPRYAPAASATRSALRIPAAGRNGSSRYGLAFFDSSPLGADLYVIGTKTWVTAALVDGVWIACDRD
jgi:hypothetical protein